MKKPQKQKHRGSEFVFRPILTARTRRLVEVQVVKAEGPRSLGREKYNTAKASVPKDLVEYDTPIECLVSALSFVREFIGHGVLRDSSLKIGLPLTVSHEYDHSLLSHIEQAIYASEFHPSRLVFHAKELRSGDSTQYEEIFAGLRQLGASLSVDSFIADGERFEVLSNPHVGYINCDTRLMKSALQYDLAWSFIHGLLSLARQTQKEIVFGGVDTENELEFVSGMGDVLFHGEYTHTFLCPGEEVLATWYNRDY
ncbi:EAL domain-containing protein [Vreelandella venusta]|uniref:EAL domain-containing protein n=1 Tax=Vreelandella venusta TaxID=44935 RepID=UPI00384C07A5